MPFCGLGTLLVLIAVEPVAAGALARGVFDILHDGPARASKSSSGVTPSVLVSCIWLLIRLNRSSYCTVQALPCVAVLFGRIRRLYPGRPRGTLSQSS